MEQITVSNCLVSNFFKTLIYTDGLELTTQVQPIAKQLQQVFSETMVKLHVFRFQALTDLLTNLLDKLPTDSDLHITLK